MAPTRRGRLPPLYLPLLALLLAFAASAARAAEGDGYYGKFLGKLKTLHHGVAGDVYAVDARTLHIRNFNYDGEGPAAFFYAGDSKSPNGSGFRINDEKGSPNVLPKYRNKHITLTLPENKTLRDIRWFSVWCDEFSVNFGDVRVPKGFEYPRPQKVDALRGVHGVASEPIVVVDAQTLLVPAFSYDGEAPDAKFWVGRGAKPSPQGTRVPDENGKEAPLRRYDRKTIVLTLPGDVTVHDIGHFGVWCEAFTVDFGHVRLPRALNVPPSLKMLGVSPQSKLNCEVLWDENAFEVRWAVAGDSVVIQLVGKIEDGEYMSFGLSGAEGRSRMVGGDVAVAWVNHSTLAGGAHDYFLDAKSQCAGTGGSCPDWRIREDTNSIRLLNAAMVNGYSIVTYQRPLAAQDELDRPIATNGSQPVIWALGPLNSRGEVSYHRVANRHDVFIDFARSPKWNCPVPETDTAATATAAPSSAPSADGAPSATASSAAPGRGRRPTTAASAPADATASAASDETAPARRPSRPAQTQSQTPAPPARVAPATDAWDIPAIQCYEPDDGVFYAQMGPTGGRRGYSAITGHVGWGISWYINGLLIPEVNVVRGRTYTFVVEGGHDAETPARYHPFYITDDPVGGYQYKTPEERDRVRVFAGVRVNRRGEPYPTGTGRLCNWTPDPMQPPAEEFASFGAYQRTLTLECDPGEAGVVQWTPDANTPDTVYYQCYTHRYLGWKINVHDSCDAAAGAASELSASRVPAPVDAADADDDADDEDAEGELQARPSAYVATRVRPDAAPANSLDAPDAHRYIPLSLAFDHTPAPAPTPTPQPLKPSPPDLSAEPTTPAAAPPRPANATRTTDIKLVSSTANPSDLSASGSASDGPERAPPPPPPRTTTPLYQRPLPPPLPPPRPHALAPHGYILPGGRHPAPMGPHPVLLHRPQPYMLPFRRPLPLPHRPAHMPLLRPASAAPAASALRPAYISTPLPPNYMLTSKKPLYRVTLMNLPGRTPHPLMGQAPFHRPLTTLPALPQQQQQYSSSYKSVHYSLPPQRVKYDKLQALSAAPAAPASDAPKHAPDGAQAESAPRTTPAAFPSPLLGTTTESGAGPDMPLAVNTGFRPETVVVEGGFKPIVNKHFAQDRSSLDTATEFVDQDELYERLEKEMLDELVKSAEERVDSDPKANPFEGQPAETFEPMFIPSPPDRASRERNASALTSKALRPVRSFRPSEGGSYLPPGTLRAYDGSPVADPGLAAPLPAAAAADAPAPAHRLRATPQFGPYLGEVPPLEVDPQGVPHLHDADGRAPPFHVPARDAPPPPPLPEDALATLGSEVDEVYAPHATKLKGNAKHHAKKASEPPQGHVQDAAVTAQLETTVANLRASDVARKDKYRPKRDAYPHHEPGHIGTDVQEDHTDHTDHDSQHDHRQHDHSAHDHSAHVHEHSHAPDPSKTETKSQESTKASATYNLPVPLFIMLNTILIIQIARYIY